MTNETLADIVAELRADANAVMDDLHNDDCWTNVEAGEIYASLANRIEAAAERERAHQEALRINECIVSREEEAADWRKRTGNAAAMREALDEILNRIDTWRTDGSMDHWQYSQLFDIADAALAAPARNCDVGTIEEQLESHRLYCIGLCTIHECGYDLEKHDTETCKKCFAKWAQMPYREGGQK